MIVPLLVKNRPNTWFTGDVVHRYKSGESPGRMESKTLFLATLEEGETEADWPSHFVKVNITGLLTKTIHPHITMMILCLCYSLSGDT